MPDCVLRGRAEEDHMPRKGYWVALADVSDPEGKKLASLMRGTNRDLKGSLLSWYDRYVEGRVPVPWRRTRFEQAPAPAPLLAPLVPPAWGSFKRPRYL